MDPVTALGAVAAGLQLAGTAANGLLGTIRFLKDLQDVPKRTAQLLKDVHRDIASINDLLRPDTPQCDGISAEQYARFSASAVEARKAMDELHQMLQPLVTADRHVKGKRKSAARLWRAVMSIKNEKDLEAKLVRVQRLNSALLRDLSMAAVGAQATLLKQSAEVAVTTTDTRVALYHHAASSLSELQQANSLLAETRSMVEERTESLANDLGRITLASDQISREVSGHTVEVVSQLRARNESLEEFIRLQHQIQSTELLAAFRRELQTQLAPQSRRLESPMENLDSAQIGSSAFEVNVQQGIVKLESNNGQTSTGIHAAVDSPDLRRPKRWRCRCKAGRQTKVWNYGRFGFRVETQAAQSCPLHGVTVSWSYSVVAQLSPWLRRALELTVGACFGSSGWYIKPPLRLFVTVKRSESPIFHLFDQFIESFRAKDDRTTSVLFLHRPTNDKVFFRWNEEDTRSSLIALTRDIESAVCSGLASGSDTDEYGNTLLFEIFHLIFLLGNQCITFAPQLGDLLAFAHASNVDPWAILNTESREYTTTEQEREYPMTAMQYLFRFGFGRYYFRKHTNQNSGYDLFDLTLYSIIMDYDELKDSIKGYGYMRRYELQSLLTHPEIAEGLGYSDLCLAVIRRSLSAVKTLAAGWFVNTDQDEGLRSPVELALGWPEGLSFLVDHSFDISSAFEAACGMNDLESASALLRSPLPIFEPMSLDNFGERSPTWVLDCARRALSFDIYVRAVEELQRRRAGIQALMEDHLSEEERVALGWREDTMRSDDIAGDAFDLLASRIDVPRALHGCHTISPHGHQELYRSQFDLKYNQQLYQAGFEAVDVPDKDGRTPLCKLVESRVDFQHDPGFQAKLEEGLVWFLERGASPCFFTEQSGRPTWPHLLFNLADIIDEQILPDPSVSVTQACSHHYLADDCECYCSINGCLPPYMFWRCGVGGYDMGAHENCIMRPETRRLKLQGWVRAWPLFDFEKECYYREICRLELFERLGMAHTCCATRLSRDHFVTALSAEEQESLRSEDAVSADQLKFMINEYQKTRKKLRKLSLDEFWDLWWVEVNKILPPLFPEEACRKSSSRLPAEYHREDCIGAALEHAGYQGMDFDEVITRHFMKFRKNVKVAP